MVDAIVRIGARATMLLLYVISYIYSKFAMCKKSLSINIKTWESVTYHKAGLESHRSEIAGLPGIMLLLN